VQHHTPPHAGATTYRTNAIKALLACKPSVIRGNASEVMTAAGAAGKIKGAESTAEVSESVDAAKGLAQQLECIVAVSGKEDYVRTPTER
jgi:hydroxyethylthiazole kinase